jgi:hypothetical protein
MMPKISGIYERDFTCKCHVGHTGIFPIWLNQPNWVSYRVIVVADGCSRGCICVIVVYRNGTIKNIGMASTGVLPFVRGVDFTSNDFSVSLFIVLNKWCYKINTMNFSFPTWCFTLNEEGLWRYKRPVAFRLLPAFRRNLLPPSLGYESDGLLQIVDEAIIPNPGMTFALSVLVV